MKKFCLTLGTALVAVSGFASERILYQQNFETVSTPEEAGWSFGGTSISIASDDYGKFLELSQGQVNGRNGLVTWGKEIFLDEEGNSVLEDGTYTAAFDFCIAANSNNQYNTEITLFTNHAPIANNTYRLPWTAPLGPWDTFIFDALQCNTAADTDMLMAVNAPLEASTTTDEEGNTTYTVSTANPYTFATGEWYTVTCNVNVETRVVEYDIVSITGNILTSGEFTVPEYNTNGSEEPVSMFVEGMNIMVARYATVIDIDNIKVSFESSKAIANNPTVALTRLGKDADDQLNLNLRAYTITFLEGETLHVKGTNGATEEVDYYDCDGAYVYETTTSGTMEAWTTCEDATSEVITTEIDCVPCVLPAAAASITSVEAGFGKIYTLTVDNSDVLLRPTIFINYEFKGENGESIVKEGEASGVQVYVPGKGTLAITTQAFGYQETTVSVENNIDYIVKKEYDFARMTREELKAAGFTEWQELNSDAMSGFSNWTARKRLYYNLEGSETVNDEGETVYTAVYPFGYVSAEGPVLNYSEIGVEGGDLGINVAGYELFPGINVFAGHNVTVLEHIGVTNNATAGGNNKNIDIKNLDSTDVVVANKIGSYGSNSIHPVVATDEEYYAVLEGEDSVYLPTEDMNGEEHLGTYSVSVDIYRIDTVCTRLTIYAQNSAGVETIGAEFENNDPWFYTIDGLRVAEPTRPGLYIHQGKKIIVRK